MGSRVISRPIAGWGLRDRGGFAILGAVSDSPAPRPERPAGRHRARPGQGPVAGGAAGPGAAQVTRRVAMAAFGGATVGGLIEVLTDRTPAAAPVAAPTGSPTTTRATAGTTAGTTGATTATARPATSAPTPAPTTNPSPSPSPPIGIPFPADEALRTTLTDLPRGKNVAFGVGLLDAATGRRFVFEAGSPFEMASTVKVDILVATYLRATDAGRDLTASEKALASKMIRNSDNTAATSLFRAAGRAPGMTTVYRRMGMDATKSAASWGLTTTTPGDRLIVLDALARGGGALAAQDGAEILGLMRAVATDQRWGVGGAARAGETVAVKNGWLPRSNQAGRWIVSTSGLLTGPATDLRLAVCSRGHASQAAGIAFIEQVLRTARDQLGV